jgi:hypothetical protein
LNAFELDVLGRVADDYEAVHTIRSDIERDLARTVSASEIEVALVRLVEAGFVDAYSYDAQGHAYGKVNIGSAPAAELWFLISGAGRAEYERSGA